MNTCLNYFSIWFVICQFPACQACMFVEQLRAHSNVNLTQLPHHSPNNSPPETNIAPARFCHPKRKTIVFQLSIFRCKLAVSFREDNPNGKLSIPNGDQRF